MSLKQPSLRMAAWAVLIVVLGLGAGCRSKPGKQAPANPLKQAGQPAPTAPAPTAAPTAAEPVKAEGKPAEAPANNPAPTGSFIQAYSTRGVVRELKPDGKTVVIAHEEIPGYMPAMVMPFEAHDPRELAELKVGDTVSFQLVVTATDGWIEQVMKVAHTNSPAAAVTVPGLPGPLRVVREVEPLNVGDTLPAYVFTNTQGRAVDLAEFNGQAVALTFIFTRCPFPNFCPQMSRNFMETQAKLKKSGVKNWHLLTLSFDPAYDTPEVLKRYAEAQGADPAKWDFLTGNLTEVTAITEQFGVQFWRDNPNEPINHNLRTVVIDPKGRIQKIIPNNTWTSDELVAEMLKAAVK